MARTATFDDTSDTSAPQASTEELSRQIEALKADIGAISQTLTDMAKSRGEDLSAAARKRLAEIKAQSDAQLDALNARATELGIQTGEFVHRKPGMALGIAAGAGLLAGLMLGARNHR